MHGLSIIYPNPLNPRRYVVINSGHTFQERDFRASNSWLFPRLGDIAVQKLAKDPGGGYSESTVWARIFNAGCRGGDDRRSQEQPHAAGRRNSTDTPD